MIKKTKIFLIVIFGFLIIPIIVFSQTEEYTIKAVFLERFTRFIEWPGESEINDTTKPFVISVIGKNPFGNILEETYSAQKILNKNVEIRYISKIDQIEKTNILFISKSKDKELSKILSYTKGKPILTVGDTKGFAKKGVMINFYLSSGKLRFEINETAVKESGLSMSYLLLQVALIVKKN
jgi:hypothetical protein